MDQQFFKFKVNSGTNQELWGVNCDFKANQNEWTIDAILQHMHFYPTTENPCVMMRENVKTKSSEYMIICQDQLYIVSTTPENIFHMLKDKYRINIYLQGEYPHDICQLKEYLEKLYVNVNILFKDKLPRDLHLSFKIIKLLIKKAYRNLIHNKTTYEHLNDLSRKRKQDKLYNEV